MDGGVDGGVEGCEEGAASALRTEDLLRTRGDAVSPLRTEDLLRTCGTDGRAARGEPETMAGVRGDSGLRTFAPCLERAGLSPPVEERFFSTLGTAALEGARERCPDVAPLLSSARRNAGSFRAEERVRFAMVATVSRAPGTQAPSAPKEFPEHP